ncbi:MAG: CDP-alcohol phosphatidyltransferase family protein [Patescibacteria group bacterium]
MQSQPFGGDKKVGQSLLHGPEQVLIQAAAPRVPAWIKSHHLTLASIPISLLIILCSYLGKESIEWLWAVSGLIALQWITDSLDGAVGRLRKEGLIRWGYYMDHLLDFFFLASILIGYMLLLPDKSKWIHFFVLAIFGGFMVNSFLAFAATNKFRVSYLGFGPTEARLVFILINTLIILFGKTYLAFSLPYILGFALLGLIVVIYKTQKETWEMDMEARQNLDK